MCVSSVVVASEREGGESRLTGGRGPCVRPPRALPTLTNTHVRAQANGELTRKTEIVESALERALTDHALAETNLRQFLDAVASLQNTLARTATDVKARARVEGREGGEKWRRSRSRSLPY